MKLNGPELERRAAKVVAECFADVPFCSLRWTRWRVRVGTGGIDALGRLSIEGEADRTLLLEAKSAGQPRLVREAAHALRRYGESFENPYGVVAAPYISDAAADILTREGVGYVDFAGNCRITVGKVYIVKEGKSNPFTEQRGLRSLYSPKAERVLRVLMENPRRTWLVQALAEAAQVSLGQAFNVKKLLDAREWIEAEERGFRMTAPEALLREWSANYRFGRSRTVEVYAMESIDAVERAIAERRAGEPRGVLTAFSAAARFAPAVRYQKVSAYVRAGADSVAAEMRWKRVPSGGNVSLIEPYDEGVFAGGKDVEGVAVVSPVQAYLDLQANVGRGEEAAEAIYREVLRPSW
ncbi:MAG TPA: type IV toxin-antitoxin system AbiEi family antitoxin [Phycisphaerae bacterium]|nr:type IV toxin-antitoxin system AbiEi family antitoxin [Phycisphaerae bacterium]